MKNVHKLAYICANLLMKKLNENHQRRSIYYYGLIIVFGAIIKGIFLVGSALILDVLYPTLFVVFVFASIRIIIGGYHMDTYNKCILISLFLFLLIGIISKNFYSYISNINSIILSCITFIVSLFCIIKWAPKENPNRPINNPIEIRRFRRLGLIYIFVWIIISIFYNAMIIHNVLDSSFKMYSISACLSLLLAVFTISPIGYTVFDFISAKRKAK